MHTRSGTALSNRALLERLVAFPSVSRDSSIPIADFVADYAEQAGCDVYRQVYEDGRKANLLIRRGPARSGAGLLLSGHLDVVPADEPDWRSDPFVLTERDGCYYGRGSADMKGFVALALNLLVSSPDEGLTAPLALLLTSDEELGSLGAQAFRSAIDDEVGPLPGQALIGEPTGLRVVRMHKGHLKLEIVARGRPAHSGYPHLGVNAIERMTPVLQALSQLARSYADRRVDSSTFFPDAPAPTLNLGTIVGGSAINVVPEQCTLRIGIRLLPGQDSSAAIEEVRDTLARLDGFQDDKLVVSLLNDSPPMLCPADAPLCQALMAETGESQSAAVSFASDAGTLQMLGIQGVLWGPGSIKRAHQANEFIEVDQFETAAGMLPRLVARFCEEPQA